MPVDAAPAPAAAPASGATAGERAELGALRAAQRFPARWGEPPAVQTMDLVALPGGYGEGSSTLARWIQAKLDVDFPHGMTDGDGAAGDAGAAEARGPAPARFEAELRTMVGLMGFEPSAAARALAAAGGSVQQAVAQLLGQ